MLDKDCNLTAGVLLELVTSLTPYSADADDDEVFVSDVDYGYAWTTLYVFYVSAVFLFVFGTIKVRSTHFATGSRTACGGSGFASGSWLLRLLCDAAPCGYRCMARRPSSCYSMARCATVCSWTSKMRRVRG
jgi:hypothetical protein